VRDEGEVGDDLEVLSAADRRTARHILFLKGPTGIALDGAGNRLVCEEGGHRVWRLTPENPAGRRTADRDRR
jgi:hypothetical protein